MITKKQNNFCDSCGGTNVLIDAWAKYDPETDEMELYNMFDNAFCEDCDGECTYERRDIH